MARTTNRLGDKIDIAALGPGKHADGGGLSLIIDRGRDGQPASPRWVMRIYQNGKTVDVGLGRAGEGGLSAPRARLEAARIRAAKAAGETIETKKQAPPTPRPEDPKRITFGKYADQFLADIEVGFRNDKHIDQWRMTLKKICAPIRDKAIADITVTDIVDLLKPIWIATPETANRARGRLERIFEAATLQDIYSGRNPAHRPHIKLLMPKRPKRQQEHHEAMSYADVPEFFAGLATARVQSLSNFALRFLILTAARSGEVREARWNEIDEEAKTWTVPASRMKAEVEHVVPLTDEALRVLEFVRHHRKAADDLIFPGMRKGRPLSDMSLAMVLRKRGLTATPHGFRSSFRDWAFEQKPNYPKEIAEMCLAHTVGSKVERAYRRSKGLDMRRKLLTEWALFVDDPFR